MNNRPSIDVTVRNCWEFKKCERQPGGVKVPVSGLCPTTTCKKSNGINNGMNAGRSCWVVAGTFCGDKVQGTFAEKLRTCMDCDFYAMVRKEEGYHFVTPIDLIK